MANATTIDAAAHRRSIPLLRYLGPHWQGLGAIVLAMLGMVALDVVRPWPMKLLVDHVLGGRPLAPNLAAWASHVPGALEPTGLLVWVCVATVFLFIISTLLSIVHTVASVTLGQRITYDLGADLFRHLQRLSLIYHSRRHVGDLAARVTGDAYCLQTLVTGVFLPLAQSVVTLAAMFFVMWKLHAQLTLISLSVVPFLVLTIRTFGGPMKQQGRHRRDLEGRLASLVQQTLHGLPAVQAFTREDVEHARFRQLAQDTVAAYRRTTRAQLAFKLIGGLITAIGTAAIMWLGAREVLEGRLTVGTVLVFLSYLGALYGPLNTITLTTSTWQGAIANAERVSEVLSIQPDVQDAPDARHVALAGAVRYEDVTFGYEQGRPVLHGVSLSCEPGEVVAIVGPTGAGKTTLVNLLIRFFDAWSGRVTIDGHDVRNLTVRSLRQQVAMVLQEPFIFPMTAAENIAYGRPGASREQIVTAAVAANADDFIQRLPQGYDTVIGERGATLSGGEKQRLSIARAFLKDAPILILDEPTSALDARTETLLLEALGRLMRGRTTFIIAHRFSTIRHADQIVVVDQGRIVERGRHDQLMARGDLYATLYRQQAAVARHESPAPVLEAAG